jgi:hypothetical protein
MQALFTLYASPSRTSLTQAEDSNMLTYGKEAQHLLFAPHQGQIEFQGQAQAHGQAQYIPSDSIVMSSSAALHPAVVLPSLPNLLAGHQGSQGLDANPHLLQANPGLLSLSPARTMHCLLDVMALNNPCQDVLFFENATIADGSRRFEADLSLPSTFPGFESNSVTCPPYEMLN